MSAPLAIGNIAYVHIVLNTVKSDFFRVILLCELSFIDSQVAEPQSSVYNKDPVMFP